MSEKMRELMNLVEGVNESAEEYRLEGRYRVVVSGVDGSDGYAIEDILDEYGQVHEAEIRGRDLVAFVTFSGTNEDAVESAIAKLGYGSVSFDIQIAEQSQESQNIHAKARRHVFGRLMSKLDGMAHDAGNELFGDDRDRLHDLTRAILDDDGSAVENEVLTKIVPDLAYAEDGPRWDFIEEMAEYADEEFSKYYASQSNGPKKSVRESKRNMVQLTMPGWTASEIASLVSDLELDDEEHDMDDGVLFIAKKHVKAVVELALEYDDDTPAEEYVVSDKPSKQVKKQVVSDEVAKALKMLGYYYDLTNRNLQVGGPFILRVLPKRIQLIGRDIEYVPRRRTDIEVDPQQIVDELNAIKGVEITLRKR